MNQLVADRGIGGNRPPLTELLTESYADLLKDIADAVASAGRAPEKIEDDETQGKFGDLTRHLTKLAKDAKDAHKSEKDPFLQAGRDVDGFFNKALADIKTAKDSLEDRSTAYLLAKETAARKAAEAEAAKAAEEAARQAEVAQRAMDTGDTDTALEAMSGAAEAEATAEIATAKATAKAADLVRTHSAGGSVTTLKKKWTGVVEDYTKVPLETLRPYFKSAAIDDAVKAFVNAGGRKLEGVRIYEAAKSNSR